MVKTGRNDPCPCGSGLKYKKCCELTRVSGPEVLSLQNQRARELIDIDKHLFREILEGSPALVERVDRLIGSWKLDPSELADVNYGLLYTWAFYHLKLDTGLTAGEAYVARSKRLGARERAWIEGQINAWLGLWRILDVDVGRSVTLMDELSGEHRKLYDVGASKGAQPGYGLFGILVDCEGITVTGAMHNRMLLPAQLDQVVAQARERLSSFDVKTLGSAEAADAVIPVWFHSVRYYDEHPYPELQNTDGHALRHVTETLYCPADRLTSLKAALLAQPGCVERGDKLDFVESRPNGALETVLVGSLRMDEGTLTLETNSVKRANALRKLVEEVGAGSELSRGKRNVNKVRPGPPGGQSVDPELLNHPEVQQAMANIRKRMNESWLEQKLPALKNETPRQAALTAQGRQWLQSMFVEFERRGDPPDELEWLRTELNLPSDHTS
jgi:hypothetical protein